MEFLDPNKKTREIGQQRVEQTQQDKEELFARFDRIENLLSKLIQVNQEALQILKRWASSPEQK